jgi:hypothetical protein
LILIFEIVIAIEITIFIDFDIETFLHLIEMKTPAILWLIFVGFAKATLEALCKSSYKNRLKIDGVVMYSGIMPLKIIS